MTASYLTDVRGLERPTEIQHPYRPGDGRADRRGHSVRPIGRLGARPDYRDWSVEELRAFAAQLQLPNANRKTRSELLALFSGTSR